MRLTLVSVAAVALALAAAGCSAPRGPEQEIEKAEMAVRTATQTGVPESAALDMRLARDKLERAREALAEEDYERAKRLGEQASVDAQVAMAKSDSEAAREAAQELERSIQTLRDEAERGGEEVQ
jgi:hypothetical protein